MSDQRGDPLSDIVLRCTVPAPVPADSVTRANSVTPTDSVAPARAARTPQVSVSRATPAVQIRQVLIDAAKRLMLVHATAVTLEDAAEQAGVSMRAARAQFGGPDDLLRAVLLSEIETLIGDLGHRDLFTALIDAAMCISQHPLLEVLSGPAEVLLARMARVDVRAPGWILAAHAVEASLARVGLRGSPMVLRWLASYVCAPGTGDDIRADAEILVAGLPPLPARATWNDRRTG